MRIRKRNKDNKAVIYILVLFLIVCSAAYLLKAKNTQFLFTQAGRKKMVEADELIYSLKNKTKKQHVPVKYIEHIDYNKKDKQYLEDIISSNE